MARFFVLVCVAAQLCVLSQGQLSLVQVRAEIRSRPAPDVNVDWLPDRMSLLEGEPLEKFMTDGASPGLNDKLTAFGGLKDRSSGTSVIGFGFQKCATTLINGLLNGEDFAINPGAKEKHYFFGDNTVCLRNYTGTPSYANYINDCFGGEFPREGSMTLDFTPNYASAIKQFVQIMKVLRRQAMKEHNTELRFLAVLRDPVARAASAINMMRRMYDASVFPAGLQDADLDSMILEALQDRRLGKGGDHTRLISDGEYVNALPKLLEEFGNSSVLVVNSDKLSRYRTWERIYNHIGFPIPTRHQFIKKYSSARQKLDTRKDILYLKTKTRPYVPSMKVRRALSKYYAPFDRRLWQLLGQTWW